MPQGIVDSGHIAWPLLLQVGRRLLDAASLGDGQRAQLFVLSGHPLAIEGQRVPLQSAKESLLLCLHFRRKPAAKAMRGGEGSWSPPHAIAPGLGPAGGQSPPHRIPPPVERLAAQFSGLAPTRGGPESFTAAPYQRAGPDSTGGGSGLRGRAALELRVPRVQAHEEPGPAVPAVPATYASVASVDHTDATESSGLLGGPRTRWWCKGKDPLATPRRVATSGSPLKGRPSVLLQVIATSGSPPRRRPSVLQYRSSWLAPRGGQEGSIALSGSPLKGRPSRLPCGAFS